MGDGLVLYAKAALGQYEQPITVLKVRTMRRDADKDLGELVQTRGRDERGGIPDDPRVTPLGKVLRRYWLNELPQLYNVMKGEMSLVGIRPHSEEEWSYKPAELKLRALRHKPGLIPPHYWRMPKDFDDLVKLEYEYLEMKERSPIRTDLKVLFGVIYNVIFRGVRSK